jgi:uncharacterized protein YbjT (DUF2867 family)
MPQRASPTRLAPEMKALVTGGSGFLGKFVIRELVSRGHEVVALARSTSAADIVTTLGATPILGDLDDPSSIDAASHLPGAETLVNVASLGFDHAPTIVHAAEDAGITRAVFVSTTAIFTNLNAPSKAVRAAEATITESALDWTIIRPTMIYGTSGDRNMWRLLQLLRRTPIVPLPGADNLHQPVHVADLADVVATAAERPEAAGKAYDVGGPEGITLRQIVADAGEAIDQQVRVISVPAGPIMSTLGLVERTGRRLPISAEQVARLREDKAFDISAARADLDFDPRSFASGIAQEAVGEH